MSNMSNMSNMSKSNMSNRAIGVDIDPDGDTIIVLPLPVNQEQDVQEEEPLAEMRYKVSMKHLTTSSRAKAFFTGGGYKESQPNEEDGLYRWTFDEPLFRPLAFGIVMRAIHGQTKELPQEVTLDDLAEIAVVVDDLGCHEALWFFAKAWIRDMGAASTCRMSQDIPRWIFIASVFDEPDIFVLATRTAILHQTGPFTPTLPIRPTIIEQIDHAREAMLDNLVTGLFTLLQQATEDNNNTCMPECTSVTFGTLIHSMMSAQLFFPRPCPPYNDLSLLTVTNMIRDFQLPTLHEQPLHRQSHYPAGFSDFSEPWDRDSTVWAISKAKGKEDYDQPLTPWQKRRLKKDTAGTPRAEQGHGCKLRDLVQESISNLPCQVQGLVLSAFVS